MNTLLVTGANGFVGSKLCHTAAEKGYSVRAVLKQIVKSRLPGGLDFAVVNDIGPFTDWSAALKGMDVIIHLAARVHVMNESLKHPLAEYRRINVEGSRHLALMAVQAGVKRFVYVSTAKVNGESSGANPFRETDSPSPQDAYSISKWEAEEALHDISSRTGLEMVIMRPPLAYGPGVRGNMLKLLRYIDRGYPLPFGGISNKRSFISLDNLVDVLLMSATNTECAAQTFLISDGEDLSTSELIKLIAGAMNRNPHLINIPGKAFSIIGAMIPALRPMIGRLTESLVVDSTLFRSMTGWRPCQSVNDGIKSMVSEYLLSK